MSIERAATISLLIATSLVAAACSSKESKSEPASKAAPGAAPKDAEYKRSSIECAAVIAGVTSAAPPEYPVKSAAGWGELPTELQLVPPGGELCGSVDIAGGMALVRSSLYGQALADFFAPLATSTGCTMKHEIVGNDTYKRTEVSFQCDGSRWATIATDTGYQFYTVSIMVPRKPATPR